MFSSETPDVRNMGKRQTIVLIDWEGSFENVLSSLQFSVLLKPSWGPATTEEYRDGWRGKTSCPQAEVESMGRGTL